MKFLRLFACTALLQGLVLWWLNYSFEEHLWPANPMLRTGALFLAVVIPLIIYWTQEVIELPRQIRRLAILGYGIAFALLGAYLAWASGSDQVSLVNTHFSVVVASAILCFVSLNLLIGFSFPDRRWKYDQLFRYSWRNAMLVLIALFITAAFWIVLYAGAELMVLINVHWIEKLIAEPIFYNPVTSLVFAGAFALGLSRSSITESSQRFALFVSSWLLVLLLFFGVIWVVALPFAGLETLLKTKHIGIIICWFVALAVAFASCAYQDGHFNWPYSHVLSRATQIAWLSLLPITAILCWALFLRIHQYGWTEPRVWGALVATLAVVYIVGYTLSWFDRSQWMSAIARTNIVAAIILSVALVALLTPIADINRLSVISQMNRVHSGNLEPDWLFLRSKSGRFGREELEKMAKSVGGPNGREWSKKAEDALTLRLLNPGSPQMNTMPISANRFTVYPKGLALPPTFLDYVQSPKADPMLRHCVNFNEKCNLWMGDLNGDGHDEIVFFDAPPIVSRDIVFSMVDNEWKAIGYLNGKANTSFTDAQLENAQTSPSEWKDLVIAGARYRVMLNWNGYLPDLQQCTEPYVGRARLCAPRF